MKKYIALCIAIAMVLMLSMLCTPFVSAAKPATTGFDEYGYNYGANLFNGWYGYYDRSIGGGWVTGTGDAWLNMKWSQNWLPMADEPIGAWCTNHWTWFSNDILEANWYGFNTRLVWTDINVVPEAKYKVTEGMKIMKVGDDSVAWAAYLAGGAYDAQWGTYGDGVPMYVVFQDVVSIYERSWTVSGTWELTFVYGGDYVHMMVASQTDGTLTGTGYYVSDPSYTWTMTGSVSYDSITLDITYTGSNPGYTIHATGTIVPDGTLSGTWTSNAGQSGTWVSTQGKAVANYNNLIGTFNLCTTSPKGLGKPIF